MPDTPPFDRMSFAAGGHLRTALLDEHRVLTGMAGYHHIFVIAHTDDTERARQVADELYDRHDGLRGIYLILVTDEQMTAIATPGVVLNIPVLLVDDDYAPAAAAIRLYDVGQITMPTEYGEFLTEITTTRELRLGDVYTCGTEWLADDDPTGYAVYRARADYNTETGWTEHHHVKPGFTPEPGERTGAMTDGPDTVVFRIVDRAAFLAQLNLTDLAAAAA